MPSTGGPCEARREEATYDPLKPTASPPPRYEQKPPGGSSAIEEVHEARNNESNGSSSLPQATDYRQFPPPESFPTNHPELYATPNEHPHRPWYHVRTRRSVFVLVLSFIGIILVGMIAAGVVVSQRADDNKIQINNNQAGPVAVPPGTPPFGGSLPPGNLPALSTPSSILRKVSSAAHPGTSLPLTSAHKASSSSSSFSGHDEDNTMISIVASFPLPATGTVNIMTKTDRGSVTSSTIPVSRASVSSSESSDPSMTNSTSINVQSYRSSSTVASETTSAVSSISTLSQLASAYSDAGSDSRRVLVWQHEDGDLIAQEWTAQGVTRYRISDRLEAFDTAKDGTPLATAADASGRVHVFYLSMGNIISHIYETSAGKWHSGKVEGSGGSILARGYTRLSATRHQSGADDDASFVALSYQSSDREIRLAVSNDPSSDAPWYIVNVGSLVHDPTPIVKLADELGHSIIGNDVAIREGDDPADNPLLMGVEGDDEVLPWKCTIGVESGSYVDTECWWLNATTGDQEGDQIPLESPPTQFSWTRLGPETTVKKRESSPGFSFLCLDSDGRIEDTRLGLSILGLRRVHGTNFGKIKVGDDTLDHRRVRAFSVTGEGVLFARADTEVLAFHLEGDEWQFDGMVNTTLPN